MKREEELTVIKPLDWEYHGRPMLTYVAFDERGMMYHINQAFGSDSYYFATVRFDGAILYDGDDLPSAKTAAQADYEARIRSALISNPKPEAEPVACPAGIEIAAQDEGNCKSHVRPLEDEYAFLRGHLSMLTEATEGVDRQAHHSKPVVSQNTQIVEDKGAHEEGDILDLYRMAAHVDVTMEGVHFLGVNRSAFKRAWEADRAALTAKQTDGRDGE